MIAKEKKQAIIKEFGRTEGDTGSPEVQVAILLFLLPVLPLLVLHFFRHFLF